MQSTIITDLVLFLAPPPPPPPPRKRNKQTSQLRARRSCHREILVLILQKMSGPTFAPLIPAPGQAPSPWPGTTFPVDTDTRQGPTHSLVQCASPAEVTMTMNTVAAFVVVMFALMMKMMRVNMIFY